MRTITLEEHFTTANVLKAAAQTQSGPRSEFVGAVNGKLLDLGEGRIADMDEAGIDVQVLSLVNSGIDKLDPETAVPLLRDVNDEVAAAVRAHPDRFAAFAAVALQSPEKAAAELERCVCRLGFKGAMLHGTVDGIFLDHPRFTPFFEAAQALDAPIYLHPTPPPLPVQDAYFGGLPGNTGFLLSTAAWGWHVELGMHCLRLIVSGLFDRFPKLKIVIGHMGEDLPYSIARADAVFSARGTTHLQRRVADYFREHFYVTNSGYFTEPPLLCALRVMGPDRLLFSVDYPFSPNMQGRAFLNGLSLDTDFMENFTHRNAERLLKV